MHGTTAPVTRCSFRWWPRNETVPTTIRALQPPRKKTLFVSNLKRIFRVTNDRQKKNKCDMVQFLDCVEYFLASSKKKNARLEFKERMNPPCIKQQMWTKCMANGAAFDDGPTRLQPPRKKTLFVSNLWKIFRVNDQQMEEIYGKCDTVQFGSDCAKHCLCFFEKKKRKCMANVKNEIRHCPCFFLISKNRFGN